MYAVLSSNDFYGAPLEEEAWYGDDWDGAACGRALQDLSFAAESFEAFMCRFWIENEIWYAAYEGSELLPECRRYVEQYRKRN